MTSVIDALENGAVIEDGDREAIELALFFVYGRILRFWGFLCVFLNKMYALTVLNDLSPELAVLIP